MADTTVTKVDSTHSPRGKMGQKYLASGVHVAMRLWEEEPEEADEEAMDLELDSADAAS